MTYKHQKDTQFPRITEGALEELRSRLGAKISRDPEPWCFEATRDNIRHYAHGIGDDNPLWCEPDYGVQTKNNSIIALPSFIIARENTLTGSIGVIGNYPNISELPHSVLALNCKIYLPQS